jgi:Zn-dependent protease
MRQTIPLGRIAGIRIGAHWSVMVMVALIGWLLGAGVLPAATPGEPAAAYWAVAVPGALAFIAALLAHELAHSLLARRYGVPVTSITLWALGGVSELGSEPPTAAADLRIAAAGPATSAAAGLIFGGLAAVVRAAGGPRIAVAALGWLAVMNIFLAAFNLLPGAPLDGGRILRAILWTRYGDRARAAQSAATAGRVLGAMLIAFGLSEFLFWTDSSGLWLALIGMFVMSAAAAEAAAGTAAAALAGLRVGDVMTPDPDTGVTWMSVADFIAEVALKSGQSEFPVIGPGGSLAGVTGLSRLAQVPADRRASTTLGQVMISVPPGYVARPDDPAAPLLSRPPLAGDLAAIVVRDDRITGIVTLTRLRQIIRREALRPRGTPGPPAPDLRPYRPSRSERLSRNMPQLRDFLARFRPAGAPGALAPVGVPADRSRELEAEVGPVLAMLESTAAERARIIDQARYEAEQITAAARAKAAGIAADAERRALAAREEAARQEVALARDEAARAVDSARQQAARTRELARQRMPDLVGRTVDAIRRLDSAGP